MSKRYANSTEVPSDRSRLEIERTLARYGADRFAYGWNQNDAMIGFETRGRQIKFVLPLPDRDSREFTRTPTGQTRASSAANAAFEQSVRQRWRALALVIKAKLEAVEAGIVTFEDEFSMHMVLPNGQTVREIVLPAIEKAYLTGQVPTLLAIEGYVESPAAAILEGEKV